MQAKGSHYHRCNSMLAQLCMNYLNLKMQWILLLSFSYTLFLLNVILYVCVSIGCSLGGWEEWLLPSPPEFKSLEWHVVPFNDTLLLLSPQFPENAHPPHVLSWICGEFFVDIASTIIQFREPHVIIHKHTSL